MKMMKWLVLLVFSFSFIAGCSQNEVKTDTKVAEKQIEKKEEKKQEENKQEEQKQEDSKQEQKPAEEQKQAEKQKEEKNADSKSIEQNHSQTKAAEPSQNQQEQSKVVNEPKETPKQENVQQTQVNPVPAPEPKSEPKPEPKPEKKIVTLSVRDDQGAILGDTEVELQDGDTVFKVLGRTLKQKGIQMEYTGSGSGVYVQGINNLYEKAKGAGSGWKYSVNGVVANMGAGRYKVKQGDKIEWFYTLDYRKEER
ncbi:DUF4430 domain-containing protein [Bacillus cereus group sp. BfR-BA-01380]|uniref:DUF4430 domain-containing protein n=1 Tax=Bacillus cereus group sp. BfR-BA-01380 TaxID=2920324 RepID=UPI001F571AD3|nr:DUF4430 domain-containing protein [Bacillus cereus group sp. BfR-BA-01380]